MIQTKLKTTLSGFSEQIDFVEDTAPFVAAIAGTGGGKTQAGAMKALGFMRRNPNVMGFVTAPTYKMLTDATLRTYLSMIPKEVIKDFNKTDMALYLKTGNEIKFRSTDDPEMLRGPNLSWFHMDEAALSAETAFLVLQARLRTGARQQGWITTTPKGFNWVYQRFAVSENPDYSLHRWSARDNIYLPPDYIKHLEESYADEFALQEIEGEFVVVSGKCFFEVAILKTLLTNCRDPIETRLNGAISIWKKPDVGKNYVSGVDLSQGLGQHASSLLLMDWRTGEVVASLYSRDMPQDIFALEAVRLCEEYYWPLIGPEWNVGQLFISKFLDCGGKNMYYRDEKKQKPGVLTSSGSTGKYVTKALLEEAIRTGDVIIWDREMVSELFSYIQEGNKLGAQEGALDDRVDALDFALQMRKIYKPTGGKSIPPVSLLKEKSYYE